MSDAERRILQNQVEIMYALHDVLARLSPDLVGRAGALDRMRDDLRMAAKDTRAILEQPQL